MHRFVVYAAVGCALGILFRSFVPLGMSIAALCVLLGAGVMVWAVVARRAHAIAALGAVILCVGIGMARMDIAVPSVPPLPKGEQTFEAVVVREPDVRGTYTNLTVESDIFAHRILVRASGYNEYVYRDTLSITGEFEHIMNFDGEGGRVFNYRGFLAKDDIHAIVAFPDITIVSREATPTGALFALKQHYLDALKALLPEPSAALAGGITVGERRALGEELTQAFRDTGLIHIVVLSGYNISIVVIFLVALLSFLPKRARYLSAILGIVVFTVLVGASATVVRAALMGSIAALGAMTGRVHAAMHALVIAGFVMLMWNPYLLVFDPSFQLSFIATLGLLVGVPLLVPYLSRVPDVWGLREILAATITTQIAVVPMLAYMIGDVSLVSLLVNALVLPMIPLAMLFVFLTGSVGVLVPALALPFAFVAHALLWYVVWIVEVFAALPHAVVSLSAFPFWMTLAAYALMGALLWLWVIKRNSDLRA